MTAQKHEGRRREGVGAERRDYSTKYAEKLQNIFKIIHILLLNFRGKYAIL